MASRSDIKAGGVYVEVSARINKFLKGMNEVSKKLNGIGSSLGTFGGKVSGVGAAIAVPLAAASKVFADVGSEIDDIAQRTGASAEALSELGYAAALSGSSMSDLEVGLKTMSKSLTKVAAGGKAPQALKALGLSASALLKMAPEDQFTTIAEALSKVENPTLRAGYAMQIFGKAGANLLPMMEGGAAGIAEMRAEAERLGVSMSGSEVKAAAEYGDAMDRVGQALKGLTVRVGAALAKPLTQVANAIAEIIGGVARWVTNNQQLVLTVAGIGVAIMAIGAGIAAAGGVTIALGAVLGGVATILGAIGTAVAFLVSPLGLAVASAVALGGYLLYSSGALQQLGAFAQSVFGGMIEAISAIGNALAGGNIEAAWGVVVAAGQVAWLTFMDVVQNTWNTATAYILNTWTAASASLAQIGTTAFYSLMGVWDTVVTRMQQGWEGAKLSILIGIEAIRTAVQAIQAAISAIASGGSISDALSSVKADGQKRINDLAASKGRSIVDLEMGLQSRGAQRSQESGQINANIAQGAQATMDGRLQSNANSAAAAKKALEDARAQFSSSVASANAVQAPDFLSARLQDLQLGLAGAGGGKSESVGSFNASVAGRLGASTLESDMLKSMESMVDLLKDISDNTADGLGGIELE